MKIRLVGTRGSVARAGITTVRYGGDTSVVQVTAEGGRVVVLDAGSGLPRIQPDGDRIDILLSHLHFDHIQGLGFFKPLFDPDVETHIWGPVSTTMDLKQRLVRYLSPPLFPVRLRDLPNTHLHDVAPGTFSLGPFEVISDLVCHPGPTLGYRITENGRSFAYLPDHEPALGVRNFPPAPEWLSGADVARDVDVLLHDTQYTEDEYRERQGWGHSTLEHAVGFALTVGARRLVTFHHDPEHGDAQLDRRLEGAAASLRGDLKLIPGTADLALAI